MERDESYFRTKKRVDNLKTFYMHLTIYILVNLMLFYFLSSELAIFYFIKK
ncbi:2TM domain-containing protein [Bacillus cereus]